VACMQIIAQEKERGLKNLPVVVDPVLVSTSGHSVSSNDTIEAMRTVLLPLATVLTPNLAEASTLLGTR
jgi:hydroxymethylpyrimidine/phosphomethylpyrimidine kinase